MTIIHDLIALYNSISVDRVYHSIISILLQNLLLIPELSLEETAELCNTSIVTINRMLKQINCLSFRSFKQQIADVINGYSKYNRVFPYDQHNYSNEKLIKTNINHYLSYFQNSFQDFSDQVDPAQIENAADILQRADDIHVYGTYGASHAKQQLQVDLMFSGKQVICCDTKNEDKDAQSLGSKSSVIAQVIASDKNYSTNLPVIKRIISVGIPIIIITSTTTLNNFQEADCILTFKGTDTAMDNYFLDMIFNLICITYRTKYID